MRTFAVYFAASGRRGRRFQDAVDLMFEAELDDHEPEGPRTALWWLQACSRSGGTALTRHHRWVTEAGIPCGDRAVHEHQLLSRAVDFAVMYDGLNAPNLGCIEVLIRRMQLLESAQLDDPRTHNYEG